jgi:putative transposase
MPRKLRIPDPGVPQHVIQRGNDRERCFFDDVDFLRYLVHLRDASSRAACDVHAYVLMTNHVHLLVTPRTWGGIARMMQVLGANYVPYLNRRLGRTGTLWEGRHKAHPVRDEAHLLRCYRYIEQNPVRAKMVSDAASYRWSSYASNALGAFDPVVTPHPVFAGFGREAYRELISQPLPEAELTAVRRGVGL